MTWITSAHLVSNIIIEIINKKKSIQSIVILGILLLINLLFLQCSSGQIKNNNADAPLKQIYMSCGGGYIEAFKQINKDNYEALPKIETHFGARTSLFVPELKQLIVAVPARSGREAQLLIYQVK